MRGIFTFILEIIKIVIISVLIVLPIRYFVIQPFFVKGMSMEPNFDDGQYLIINEIGFRFEAPQRGEVVVFRYPQSPSQYHIKRIIGLPGETVEIVGGGVIIYNKEYSSGQVLDEKYLPNDLETTGNVKVSLQDEEYFVLGDNRGSSLDSRRWGPLDKDYIIGRAWIRVWPFETAKIFAAPSY